MTLAETDPADACGEPLELDPRARHVEPVMQVRVVGDQLSHLRIGLVDVLRVAGERGPAKGSYAAAEQRADILGHESRYVEGPGDPFILGDLPQVVAVIEYRHALRLEAQQLLDVLRH